MEVKNLQKKQVKTNKQVKMGGIYIMEFTKGFAQYVKWH